MNRRRFLTALLGAPLAAKLCPAVVAYPQSAQSIADVQAQQRYFIAREWPHREQSFYDFVLKGEIRGFRYGMNFSGTIWHSFDSPLKIGDTVMVRKSGGLKFDRGHIFFGAETREPITLTPEFLKTNGFPLPSIHEQYIAGRMAGPVGFKWYFDEVVPCQVMPNGWAPEGNVLKPGDHFTVTLDGKNFEGNA